MADENKTAGSLPEEKKQAKPVKAKPSKPSIFARISKWFRELRSEAKKVMWPTRKQVINNTLVVIATVFVVGIFIWTIDLALRFGVQALIQKL
jgi:preprotein translocase subunit SecE